MLRLISIALVSVFVIGNLVHAGEMKKDGLKNTMIKTDTQMTSGMQKGSMKKDSTAKQGGTMKKDTQMTSGMKKDTQMTSGMKK